MTASRRTLLLDSDGGADTLMGSTVVGTARPP